MNISDLVGIPYLLGGSSEQGSDCWGLSKLVYLKCKGILLPAYNQSLAGKRVPPRGYVAERLREEGDRAWVTVRREHVEPYDVVVLRNLRPCDHIGVICEDTQLLLTTDVGQGAHLCEWGPNSFWGPRVEGIYRYVGI